MPRPTDLQSTIMRLIRERLKPFKNGKGEQAVPNEVQRALRDEIMAEVVQAHAPEIKPHGATIMTPEASMQESNKRQGRPVDNIAARPKTI